ncbi:hypothetical protein [Noviluteimonas gilva]|uniref:Lipoprotein n=1 Tax=Noviluteimonas gilva TaxID=2682097 RepID=A0A7C9LL66_9GAMM|nr:hypothetical protein [Lysobacter gilvus]MUV13223.1 hypothetical protein [Lysobacter gilvus]
MRNASLILSVGLVSLALVACGKSPSERAAEAAIERATGQKANVDAKSGEVTIESKDGQKMRIAGGDAATLPVEFPKDVYLPSKFKVLSVMQMQDVMVVQLDVPGDLAALTDASGKKMATEGWKQTLSMQAAEGQHVTMYEKDKRQATVSFADDGEPGVKLNLQLGKQQ